MDDRVMLAVLAGHTHTTATHQYRGIQIVNSETTSQDLDKRPYGIRVCHVEAHLAKR